MEIRYCQKITEDGLDECGFLCGAYCRADPNNPFFVSGDFHNRLKIVGCQSWQRYIDYDERRKRFGETHCESTSGTGRGVVPMQGVSVKQQMAVCGEDGNETPSPMRLLQTDLDVGQRQDTEIEQPTGRDLGTCSFCNESAVIVDMRVRYCRTHADKMGL